jgi:hypothetical protein
MLPPSCLQESEYDFGELPREPGYILEVLRLDDIITVKTQLKCLARELRAQQFYFDFCKFLFIWETYLLGYWSTLTDDLGTQTINPWLVEPFLNSSRNLWIIVAKKKRLSIQPCPYKSQTVKWQNEKI